MKNSDNPTELRNTATEALDLWWGDPHDAFIMLGEYGDASSIPALRRALSRMPNDGDGPGCTRDHGLEALAKLEHRKYP